MIEVLEYHMPRKVAQALEILSRSKGVKIIAGGTDEVVRLKESSKPARVLDISRVDELRRIRVTKKEIFIGALVTHKMIEESEELRKVCPSLVQAASEVGSPQIRTRGTLGGNIANASPAGDLIPPLIILGAKAVLVSKKGKREVPVEKIFLGPGKTAISPKELLSSVVLPRNGILPNQSFKKAGQRNSLAISLASVAVAVKLTGDKIEDVRIALGSVAPTVMRARMAEKVLLGRLPTKEILGRASQRAAREARPIDDVRGHAWYRRRLVQVLVEDALCESLLFSSKSS